MPYDDHRAAAQINFCQPSFYKPHSSQFCIGYTPWESTKIPDDWPAKMNRMDAIWATSPQVATWFEANGVKGPIHYVPHGIDPIWTPKLRTRGEKLRFLHVGEPAQRKGGTLAVKAFQAAFPKDKYGDVTLTIKATQHAEVFNPSPPGYRRSEVPDKRDKRVNIVTGVWDVEKLVKLYHDHDAMVYPSQGEGFGLIPFQAVATGMPSIVTKWWCPYIGFVSHPLDYTLVESQHSTHLGKWAEPDFEHLVVNMRNIYNHYNRIAADAYDAAFNLHEVFSWDKVAEKVSRLLPGAGFDALEFDGSFDSPISEQGLRIGRDIELQDALDQAESNGSLKIVIWKNQSI